jgi:hypothetical protein
MAVRKNAPPALNANESASKERCRSDAPPQQDWSPRTHAAVWRDSSEAHLLTTAPKRRCVANRVATTFFYSCGLPLKRCAFSRRSHELRPEIESWARRVGGTIHSPPNLSNFEQPSPWCGTSLAKEEFAFSLKKRMFACGRAPPRSAPPPGPGRAGRAAAISEACEVRYLRPTKQRGYGNG